MKTKAIQNLDLSRLRVEEDFGFEKLVMAELDKLPLADIQPGHAAGLTAAVDTFRQAYGKFDDALKASATVPAAKVAAEKDARRDEAWRTMREYAKASMSFPSPDVAETAAEVYALFKKYGELADMPQTEETGRLHNLLQDLSVIDGARMSAAHFTPLLAHLRQCEEEFLVAVQERAVQEGAVEVSIIKLSRVAADAAYRTLISVVNTLAIVNGAEAYEAFTEPMNAHIDRMKSVLAARRTVNSKKPKDAADSSAKGLNKRPKSTADAVEAARLKTLAADYEQRSHFPTGSVKFTGVVAGKGSSRAYQAYLADEPGDWFWLTVKDGRLTETEFQVPPGEPGGLPVERIEKPF